MEKDEACAVGSSDQSAHEAQSAEAAGQPHRV